MTDYANAARSGVKAYSEGEDAEGTPDSITAYFNTGAYTYTRQSVGDTNFENMINLAHDGIGLCRYITANCRDGYASKVAGKIKPKNTAPKQQTSARLQGYWAGTHEVSGNTYNLNRPTANARALQQQLSDGLPSGVARTRRGASSAPVTHPAKPRIKLKARTSPASSATRAAPKPRIKLKKRK
jgi:hypothetical protein